MKELIRTNDLILISRIKNVLEEEFIQYDLFVTGCDANKRATVTAMNKYVTQTIQLKVTIRVRLRLSVRVKVRFKFRVMFKSSVEG